MYVYSAVLPQHRVPSLYQRPAALRRARLAVRGGVAKPPRRADLDVAVAERLLQPPSPPPRTLQSADLAGLATQLRVSPPPRTKGAGRAERAARPAAEDAALAQFDSEDEEARPGIDTADNASVAPKRELGRSTPVRNKAKAQAYEGAAGEPEKGPYKPSPRK